MTLILALAQWALLSSLTWSALEVLRHRSARRRAARITLPPMVATAFAFPPAHVVEVVDDVPY